MAINISMEPKLFISSPKPSPTSVLPLFLSCKSSFVAKRKLSLKTHFSLSSNSTGKSPFWGKSLILHGNCVELGNSRRPHLGFHPIRAAVKRRKELPFDNVIQRDKKLKLVFKIRKILVGQPDRTMSLRDLGRFRRELGLTKKRRLIALLKRFPAVFEIVEEGVFSLKFRLTAEAERLYLEELRIRNEMEDLLVVKLRKLLMMSLEKRILLEKIAHLRTDLGLPLEFRDTICQRYPQYFKVVSTEGGRALELTHWEPELAVSAAELAEEENRAREIEERNLIIDRPPKFNIVKLPKGLKLSKGEMRRISQFRDMPYISPYSDFSELKSGTPEKEKHACAVVHEMLSLTVEKRTLVDHLTHFREEFRFSQQLRGMLIRHPDMFYVSLKGDRDSVFLREAYQDSQLVEKDRLLLIKEKLRSLVAVPRFRGRVAPKRDSEGANGPYELEDESVEEGEGLSDVDNLMSDGFDGGDEDEDDYDDDDDDDWSDEDDDMPPNFDDDSGNVKLGSRKRFQQENNLERNEEKELALLFPDGRPRERWYPCSHTSMGSILSIGGLQNSVHKLLDTVGNFAGAEGRRAKCSNSWGLHHILPGGLTCKSILRANPFYPLGFGRPHVGIICVLFPLSNWRKDMSWMVSVCSFSGIESPEAIANQSHLHPNLHRHDLRKVKWGLHDPDRVNIHRCDGHLSSCLGCCVLDAISFFYLAISLILDVNDRDANTILLLNGMLGASYFFKVIVFGGRFSSDILLNKAAETDTVLMDFLLALMVQYIDISFHLMPLGVYPFYSGGLQRGTNLQDKVNAAQLGQTKEIISSNADDRRVHSVNTEKLFSRVNNSAALY
ncbi:Plant organelle RNA recognition domain [Dillenia turbinata]|uniref:Plant organelle RNA recognition domain n=1 Tax=Dillenia turbinata TaxID=194707 RepID=A0AAN8UMG1_9MAGN